MATRCCRASHVTLLAKRPAPRPLLDKEPELADLLGLFASNNWQAPLGRRLYDVRAALDSRAPAPPLRTFAPSISPDLERAVRAAMAPNPNDRFQSARELGAAITHGLGPHGTPLPTTAIAVIVERQFSQTLEQQRQRQRNRKMQFDTPRESATIFR